jgi:hypothetical protein
LPKRKKPQKLAQLQPLEKLPDLPSLNAPIPEIKQKRRKKLSQDPGLSQTPTK